MCIYRVRGAGDAVEVEAETVLLSGCPDVREGSSRVSVAAEPAMGELGPGQAALGCRGLELERTPAALDFEVGAQGEGLLQPELADIGSGTEDVRGRL